MSKRKAPPPHRKPSSDTASSRPIPRRGHAPTAGSGGHWIYGMHAVIAVLGNPRRHCRRVVATTETADRIRAARRADARGPDVEVLSRPEIERLLPPEAVHQGVAVLADPLPEPAIEDVLAAAAPDAPLVVLDQATDPRNVGAVLRSAAAFGAAGVIVQDRHAPEATAATAKAASGALETVPFVRVTNIARTLETLKQAGYWCVGLDADADGLLPTMDLPERIALVLGSEGRGLRRLVAESCDLLASIPIEPGMESLNLSNAAAVTLYEVARRRLARSAAG